jgi:hypothetical protein
MDLPIHSDAVVTVLQAEWHLMYSYVLNGPVPRIFAPEPVEAKAAIDNDPTKAFKDIQGYTHISSCPNTSCPRMCGSMAGTPGDVKHSQTTL